MGSSCCTAVKHVPHKQVFGTSRFTEFKAIFYLYLLILVVLYFSLMLMSFQYLLRIKQAKCNLKFKKIYEYDTVL